MLKQKINSLLIGTNNKGKLREIRSLLPKNIKIYSTLQYNLKSPAENGKTFRENSLIKSKYFSKKTKLICLADDSGLEIDLLDKKPGIFSARWGGKRGDFNKAIKRVYRELNKKDKNWKNKKIKARFVCALSISFLNKKIACVIGKVEGKISNEPRGKNGFGYDPIFIPSKGIKTFGEMKPSSKYKIDHRYQAFKKIKRFL
jgi:XTP/dITP diphosphohydrolase